MLGYQTTRADILQFVQPRQHQQSQLVGTQQQHNHHASPVADNQKGGQKKRHALEAPSVPAKEEREDTDWQFLETEYLEDYGKVLIALEKQTQPLALHMDAQPEITWEMRPILLDFIIQAHLQFNLKPETLFLTINLTDRYLSKRVVYKKHYQLLGMCSLWVAAKYEDVKDNVPTCSDLWYMCQCYDEIDFKHMERHVLQTLGYDLGFPTQEIWVKYLLATECMIQQGEEGDRKVEFWEDYNERKKVRDVARFAMEVATFHRSFVWCPASVISKGAIYLARHILGKKQINPLLQPEVLQCIKGLDQLLPTASQVIQRKYSDKRLSHASQLVQDYVTSVSIRPNPPWILPPTPDPTARGHGSHNPRQLWIQPGLCGSWGQDQNDYHGQTTQFAQYQQQTSQDHQPYNVQFTNASCRGAIPAQPACAPPTPVTPTMMVEPLASYLCTLPETDYQHRQPAPQQQSPLYRASSQQVYPAPAQGSCPDSFVGERSCNTNHHIHNHHPSYASKPNHLQIQTNITLAHLQQASQELPSPATSTNSLPSPSLSSLSISSTSTSCRTSAAQYSALSTEKSTLDSNPSNTNSSLPPVLPALPNPTPDSAGLRQVLTEYCVRWVDGGYPMMITD